MGAQAFCDRLNVRSCIVNAGTSTSPQQSQMILRLSSGDVMTYEEFEWHLLRMVYEEGVKKLSPSYLGYVLKLPHDTISSYLEQAVDSGILEPVASGLGAIEYVVPGVELHQELPTPLWKQGGVPSQELAHDPSDIAPPPHTEPSARTPQEVTLSGEDALASALVRQDAPRQKGVSLNQPDVIGHGKRTGSPPSFRTHVRTTEDHTDGSLHNVVQARDVQIDRQMVVARGVKLDEEPAAPTHAPATASMALVPAGRNASMALVPAGQQGALMRVELTAEAFCDPSRTVFMRKIRVHGVKSEQALRHQIHHLFESFGYKSLREEQDRMRFERGSVGFILALVPLFVLVVPLFVYLFLYGMGRSTIQQEPLELDVHLRKSAEDETTYDIDLTYIGLHGIVLGAADQRVLNQEIDTLRDELSWALAAS